jgi:hypothetical protein
MAKMKNFHLSAQFFRIAIAICLHLNYYSTTNEQKFFFHTKLNNYNCLIISHIVIIRERESDHWTEIQKRDQLKDQG